MKTINLREQYPDFYSTDTYVEVPDEVAAFMQEYERKEAAYRRRTYYHKAYYSLDRGDGIEYDALFLSVTPWEVYERKLTLEELHAAITTLPDKQAKRLNAYYFLGMSKAEIARAEGVNKSQVSRSINRALESLKKYLKNLR
ncbi:sigma-70 family RNA polymerase sigma factor [Dysosmobacter sp. Sow4_B12]|uniref:sigma-70 family RNA polymerase sigma factor n=1 Tax=Dysosmobacter sp. Sow4_B12 TaxID=3438777 RepID=UPI003F8E2659